VQSRLAVERVAAVNSSPDHFGTRHSVTTAPPSAAFTFLRWTSKPPSGIQVSTSPVSLFM
jgi:hypothetical protein